MIDDIVVTARRREESLQSVPVTVTALTAEALTRQNLTSTLDLPRSTPSLQITRSAQGGNGTYVQLRGIGGTETLFGQDQTVGIYFDEVPQARQEGGNLQFFDLQNVQVLYGPQGTLFGRNTVAGAIVYTTQRPTDKLEGNIVAELGNYHARWLTGALNIPIAEGLAVRFAGQLKRREGWITELNSGTGLADQNSESWRVSVRAEPVSGLTNDLIVSGFHADETQLGGAVFGSKAIAAPSCAFNPLNPTPSLANPACYYGPGAPVPLFLNAIGQMPASVVAAYQSYPTVAEAIARNVAAGREGIALFAVPRVKDKNLSITDILTADLGGSFTLKGIFGYRKVQSFAIQSGAGYELPVFEISSGTDGDQYSGELQVQGTILNDQLQFTTGGFYFRETGRSYSGNLAFAFSPAQPYSQSVADVRNTSYSLYAQTTFRPSGLQAFSLTTGFRYTWDQRDATLRSGNYLQNGLLLGTQTSCSLVNNSGGTLPLNACALDSSAKFNTPTWLITADYKIFNDTLAYVTWSRGYRSGGFNVRSNYQPVAFAPEDVDNYEGGIKTTFRVANIPFRINGAIWKMNYRNIQTLALVPNLATNPPTSKTDIINANSLKLSGGEVDVTIEPVRGLNLRGFFGVVTGTYDRYVAGGITFTDVPYGASKYSGGVNVNYEREIGNIGTLDLSANYTRRSGSLNTTTPTAPQVRGPSLGTANFRIGLSHVGGTGFNVAAFARNVGSDSFLPVVVPGANLVTGGTGVNYTEPTFYGVDLGFEF